MDWEIRISDILDTFGSYRGSSLLLEFTSDVTDSVTGEIVSATSRTLLTRNSLDIGFSVFDCAVSRVFPSAIMIWVTRGDGSKMTKDEIKFGEFAIRASVSGIAAAKSPGVRFHGVSGERLLWKVPLSLKEMELEKVEGGALRLDVEFASSVDSAVSHTKRIGIPIREGEKVKEGEEERQHLHLQSSSKSIKV
jgi:hypothetical protein